MGLNVVQLYLFQGHLGKGLGNELDNVVVVHNFIDVALIVGTGKDDNLALVAHQFIELFKLV